MQSFRNHHPGHLALALNVSVKAVVDAVPAVFVTVGQLRQHLASDAVRFVRPHTSLTRYVLAARVDNDFVESAEVRDLILNATLPLLGGCDVEALALEIADRLWSSGVGLNGPITRAWNRVVQLWHVVELCLLTVCLVYDVNRLCRMNERTSVLGALAKPKSALKNRRSASFHSWSENSAIRYFPASTCLSEFSR